MYQPRTDTTKASAPTAVWQEEATDGGVKSIQKAAASRQNVGTKSVKIKKKTTLVRMAMIMKIKDRTPCRAGKRQRCSKTQGLSGQQWEP